MPLDILGPTFETLVHAGLGLRVFQAFARALPPPSEKSGGWYRFWFNFIQYLADNQERQYDRPTSQSITNGQHI